MPYIKNEKRNKITPVVKGDFGRVEMQHLTTAGDLNYAFTMLAVNYINDMGLNYQNINDVIGALEGAKQEFYRRVVVNYENKKIAENGDVYPSFETPQYPGMAEFNGS